MADGYGIGDPIKTNAERLEERVKASQAESKAQLEQQRQADMHGFKGFFKDVWDTLKQKWDQGRDELAKALNHSADGYMPWPEHNEPNIEAPKPSVDLGGYTPDYTPNPVQKQKPLTQ